MGRKQEYVSIYLCYLLRHNPAAANLDMDVHGWVSTSQLIENVNALGRHFLTMETLRKIVETDDKGRYRFQDNESRIKACQGHSIPWVEPELEVMLPPKYLYHGTNSDAWKAIRESGAILRMSRHAVHMQAEEDKAWKSAKRWKGKNPVVLKIDAEALAAADMQFGRSDNGVWCCERVPVEYIAQVLHAPSSGAPAL